LAEELHRSGYQRIRDEHPEAAAMNDSNLTPEAATT
jgi:hypothetical protein